MQKQEVKKRIEKLKKLINHHRYLYHVLDKQEISDAALDSLKHELYQLEQENPEFLTSDSPTQRVAGKPLKGFKKITYNVPMLSIEDIFNEQELGDWEAYLKRLEPSAKFDYFVELKIDGFAVSLVYKNGILSYGSTRGDGKIGEDITQNLKTIESIPLKIELKKKISDKAVENRLLFLIAGGEIEVRGEVYMDKKDFDVFNRSVAKKGEKTYANPRNLAAGSIRQLNPELVLSRPLKFLAYDMITDTGQIRHSEEHLILSAIGFKTDSGKICQKLSDISHFRSNIVKKRGKMPFQIDGLVISIDNNNIFRKLGVSGKSPRAIRAFKFSPKQATTKVLGIKIQVGRTGAITPVAILKPIEVSGVVIARATLHNENEIKKLGIKIGDTVIIERAGDVIPAVAKVLKKLRTGKEIEFHFPRFCPVCKTHLDKPAGEAIWRCKNQNCPARKRKNLYHFVSKKSFDIDGIGPKIINQLADENLVINPPDIFRLTEKDLLPMERFAEKSAENILQSIQKSKTIEFANFIFSLGIRHVGEETARYLANYFGGGSRRNKFVDFGDIKNLQRVSTEDLKKIPNIGEKVSESILQWFSSKKNQDLINNLLAVGIKILLPKKIGKKLEGKVFVVTGSLDSLTRPEAHKRIRLLGGNTSNSVSNNTDYLVAGRDPGSKLEKARELGLKVISEKEFLNILD